MSLDALATNLLSAPVLFFFLGLLAVALKSDLDISPGMARFLALYLLFIIGIKGGEELHRSGFTLEVLRTLSACLVMALVTPLLAWAILRRKLNVYDAGAIAASYGSVSAVTFATALSFLATQAQPFGGYMVAGMALMESPAIIMGLILIRKATATKPVVAEMAAVGALPRPRTGILAMPSRLRIPQHMANTVHEAAFNGSIMLLVGSLVIGYLAGEKGEHELRPFVTDIYKGMLCFYLLDMGLVAGRRMGALKEGGLFLVGFAILYPLLMAACGIGISQFLGLQLGDALLFTVLCSSASYIAVPAAMRISVPEANMSLLLPMALGITFTFNITMGIPMYYTILEYLSVGR